MVGFDKTRFGRVSVDLSRAAKARLDKFCRTFRMAKAKYIRAALREKMRADQRAGRLRNRKHTA